MAEEFVINKMTEGDIDAVTALDAECFGVDAGKREWFAESAIEPNAHAFTSWKDGELAGFVSFFDWQNAEPPYIKIAFLMTREPYRRKGLARRMINICLDTARELGIENIKLETAADNEASRSLYEGLGFEVEEIVPNYYDKSGKDGLVMFKRGLL